ncbi:XP_014786661.1PREDICTED: uncharacterized protein LOC106880990 [Octopus vulgaris]|uniref:XP_014786661.1PREDICTED: uncharacterized protein LOC106880990 n=1 Tax=Octopus vulgaris TaxID=6645 RepID=A0AA36FBQ7_OCTVU|nr:XP_014786661.1PREDICTED: uncharacterized protein LOC106880990 [Octopus vulgaris]
MEKLNQELDKKISEELPSKVSLVIDGWTKGSKYLIGLFASYSCNYQNDYCTVSLVFSPMVSETSFTASDYVEFIEYVLSVYNKNSENVVAITGDNTGVNKSIANLCRIPLIGCASHKFNLAVSAYLDKQEVLLDIINMLLSKLKSLKLAGKLREKTPLQTIQRNKTLWSSNYDMIERYIQLKPFLDSFQGDPKLVDYLLSPRDHNDLQTLEDNLDINESFYNRYCYIWRLDTEQHEFEKTDNAIAYKETNKCFIIDIAIIGEHNTAPKEFQNIDNYSELM